MFVLIAQQKRAKPLPLVSADLPASGCVRSALFHSLLECDWHDPSAQDIFFFQICVEETFLNVSQPCNELFCTSFWRRQCMSSKACLDRCFSISRRSDKEWHTWNKRWGAKGKKKKWVFWLLSRQRYLWLVRVAALAPPCRWSAAAWAQTAAAAEISTCAPSPPPKTLWFSSLFTMFSTSMEPLSGAISHCTKHFTLLLSWTLISVRFWICRSSLPSLNKESCKDQRCASGLKVTSVLQQV